MPKDVMTPVFALLLAFLAVDVVLIVAPFFRFRYTEDPWGAPERMAFLAKAMASGLAFGLVAAVAAERRNRSPWSFLAGHASFFLAWGLAVVDVDRSRPREAPLIVVIAGFLGCLLVLWWTRTPAASPPRVEGLLLAICRVMGRVGNIWFGIVLMAAIAAAVGVGTILESMYTARAAQHYVYRSPWFCAVFFLAGLSMLAATFRKWPFRLEQAGWLTVHAGLALVVIGSMMSFLTTVEGEVQIEEGQRVDAFQLSTRTRLVVAEQIPGSAHASLKPVLETVAEFDANPADEKPERRYAAQGTPLAITVDRFFGTGVADPVWHDDGPEPRAGVVLDVYEGEAKTPRTLRLDQDTAPDAMLPIPMFQVPVAIGRALPRQWEALVRERGQDGYGAVVVRDRFGATLLTLPVVPGLAAESRADGEPATLTASATIPGTQIELRLRAYCDGAVVTRRGDLAEGSRGNPLKPAVAIVLAGKDGEDARHVYAFQDDPLPAELPKGRYPYDVRYEFEPRIQMGGPQLFCVAVGDALKYVYVSQDGGRAHGPLAAGEPLAIPMRFLRIVPREVFKTLRIEDRYRFEAYEPRMPVIRITPEWDGAALPPVWVPLEQARDFEAGGRSFAVTWRASVRPLGFSLELHDFHRDFHPGSEQPATFESYLRLVHPEKFPSGEDIKIDMNHPLRMDGWRLYQARYGNDRTTILQVNRDPGLALIYPACSIVFLGLIVVMFMKKTMALERKVLERQGAAAWRHVARAASAVALVGAGPAAFSAYAALRLPLEGWPAFAFGMLLVIVAPIGAVIWYMGPLQKKFQAALAKGAP